MAPAARPLPVPVRRVLKEFVAGITRIAVYVSLAAVVLGVGVAGLEAEHLGRRLAVGGGLLLLHGAMAVWHRRLGALLLARPGLLLVLGAVHVAAIGLDGVWPSSYWIVAYTSVVMAAASGSERLTAGCAAVVCGGIAGLGVLSGRYAELQDEHRLGNAIADLAAIPLTAGVVLLLMLGLAGFLRGLPQRRESVARFLEAGAPLALPLSPGTPVAVALLNPAVAGSLVALLTDSELAIALALANGARPKQIAAERVVSIHTVRTQIKSAKRKTGARTLVELAALVATEGQS